MPLKNCFFTSKFLQPIQEQYKCTCTYKCKYNIACIGTKVLPNAVTPSPCYSLQKLRAIPQIKYLWEINLAVITAQWVLLSGIQLPWSRAWVFLELDVTVLLGHPVYLWMGGVGVLCRNRAVSSKERKQRRAHQLLLQQAG